MDSGTSSDQNPGAAVKEDGNNMYQQPERRPFPTDSLVTIRLSETSIPPLPDAATSITPKPSFRNPLLDFKGMDYTSDNNTEKEDFASSSNSILKTTGERDSTVSSISNAEEQQVITRLSDPSSESRSRGSFSSTNSAQFDWDELDKSEEQVPRDEESDEVRSLLVAQSLLSVADDTSVNCFPSCQARTREQCLSH